MTACRAQCKMVNLHLAIHRHLSFLMLACRAPPDAAPSMLLQCEPSLAQQIAPNWPQFQRGESRHLGISCTAYRASLHILHMLEIMHQSQGTLLMCSPMASKTCSTWQPFRACADKYSMMTSAKACQTVKICHTSRHVARVQLIEDPKNLWVAAAAVQNLFDFVHICFTCAFIVLQCLAE